MKELLAHLECNRKVTLPGGHVLLPGNQAIRDKLERFLGEPVSAEYLDFLSECGGTTIYNVALPCPKSSSPARLRELPYDVWNLDLFGNYGPGADGKFHPRGLDLILDHGRVVTPVGMLPIGQHVETRYLHYSQRPESRGHVFLFSEEDVPYFDASDPANAGKEPPDPFVACQDMAPSLEAFFKGLRSFSDEEYEEWAERVNSYV